MGVRVPIVEVSHQAHCGRLRGVTDKIDGTKSLLITVRTHIPGLTTHNKLILLAHERYVKWFCKMVKAARRTCSDRASSWRYCSTQSPRNWLRSRQTDLRTRSVRSTCCRAGASGSRPSGRSEILPTRKRLMRFLLKTACSNITTVCSYGYQRCIKASRKKPCRSAKNSERGRSVNCRISCASAGNQV